MIRKMKKEDLQKCGEIYALAFSMSYMRDDDQHRSEFGNPPVVVNYFYHEEVKKSAKKKQN